MGIAYTKYWLSDLGRTDDPHSMNCEFIETIEHALLHSPACSPLGVNLLGNLSLQDTSLNELTYPSGTKCPKLR